MEYYWKIIVLLLAVIISTSKADTSTDDPQSPSSSPETTVTSPTTNSSTTGITVTPSTAAASSNTTTPSATTEQSSTSTSSTATTPAATTPTATVSSTATESSTEIISSTGTVSSTETTPSTATTSSTATTPTNVTTPLTATTSSTATTPVTTTTVEPASPSRGETTSESTTGSSPSAASTTSPTATAASGSTVTTPATPSLGFVISETNLLLTNDSSKYFIEIRSGKNVHPNNTWLVIHNASMDASKGLLLKFNIKMLLNDGLYVYANVTALSEILQDVESVLIALYADEESADSLTTQGLHDILMYSSTGNIHPGLNESFSKIMNESLIIDYKKFNISVPVSLSRCSDTGIANNVAVLTTVTLRGKNACSLTFKSTLEMKLNRKIQQCSPNSPNGFQSDLIKSVISNVNREQHCGLVGCMLTEVNVNPKCISDDKELDVKFTVTSAFSDQITLIKNGYINFLRQPQLTIKGEEYNLTNCYQNCFDGTTPPTSTDDNRIRVTVAVVVSCIGVFLLVLLFVVLYLRKKRKGILQFHMTRLDEDDDLAGDMDDFVGNQGPTFRSYR